MTTYRLLVHPSANRVYGRAAPALAAAELRTVAELALSGSVVDVAVVPTGPAASVRFTTAAPLDERATRIVATGAGTLVLFEEVADAGADGEPLLRPVAAGPLAHWPDDLLTTLKYAGKTNEQFTALLVNLALAASARGFDALLAGERVRLLDPLCGRGTTLNQALMYGLDAVGIDHEAKDVEIYTGFIRQWLRDHRYKHGSEAETRRRGPGRDRPARHTTVTIGARDDGLPHDQILEIIDDDTSRVRDHVKGSSVDLIVGDLPYGLQHAARAGDRGTAQSATDLLQTALPGWRAVLRGGGALCLAFNTRVLRGDEVDALLVAAGLTPLDVRDGRFAHQVDRSIHRDVALAVKPS
jgi:hypothetical protein